MKRLGIFVLLIKRGIVNQYIEVMLKDISCNVENLVIVCNGFVRENMRFDAGAYKDAILNFVGIEKIRKYDELLLLNADVWGMTMPPEFEWGNKAGQYYLDYAFSGSR